MLRREEESTLTGEAKSAYLRRLDLALGVLAKELSCTPQISQKLKDFGDKEGWDWSRIPAKNTYGLITQQVQRIQEEYRWFDWNYNAEDPSKNRGYFTEVNISTQYGLPWFLNFTTLHRLRKEAPELLKRIPACSELAKQLKDTLLEDVLETEAVPDKTKKLHQQAMKRNFLEQLKDAELLGWESSKYCLTPKVTKLVSLGVEELWNLTFARYSPATGMFQAYAIDLWQDMRDKQIKETENGTVISPLLDRALDFSKDNAAWYVIQEIDDRFDSLHPVHVSKCLIGPFENRYLTYPQDIEPLPITTELLKEDSDAALLRFSRQYSYAPNSQETDGKVRQIIYREDWRDEVIVCPAAYAPRVASSVLGTNVRIFEM